jgi:signal transduction histidine kinase
MVLMLIIVLLIVLLIKQRNAMRDLKLGLREVSKKNLNYRFRTRGLNMDIKDINNELNEIVSKFQENVLLLKEIEEKRRKFISNISHDLRTPLSAILGYIEALQNDTELSALEQKHYLQVISQKGLKISALMEEFFELAKLDADDVIFEKQKVNLTKKIKEVLVTFFYQCNKEEIEPILVLPSEDIFVSGDEKSIERILNNLFSNAINYGKDGKELGIRIYEQGENVYVEIWDRGKGIIASEIPRLFERLHTGVKSRNNSLQGNGLGLTITKKLVEKQNGEIFISSIPGQKTTVTFYLPSYIVRNF